MCVVYDRAIMDQDPFAEKIPGIRLEVYDPVANAWKYGFKSARTSSLIPL